MNDKRVWLCCNRDGSYVVYVEESDWTIDYIDEKSWKKIRWEGCRCIKDDSVPIHERHFATNLQGLKPGEKVLLT